MAEPRCAPSEDVTAMQDQLYDILATGVAPGPGAAVDVIEAFLHEHARAPKSHAEFEAFFARCDLTPAPTALPPPRDGGFTLPPFGDSGASSPVVRFVDDDDTPLPAAPPAFRLPADDEIVQRLVAPPRAAPPLLWAGGLLLACAVLGVVAWLGHGMLQELRSEVRDARATNAEHERVIGALQSQAAGIESGVAANGELIQLMDQKSDLMLQSLEREAAAGAKPQRRWAR
jgi:hypothetical protein